MRFEKSVIAEHADRVSHSFARAHKMGNVFVTAVGSAVDFQKRMGSVHKSWRGVEARKIHLKMKCDDISAEM